MGLAWPCVCRSCRLEQALNNLVTNAIKYSPRDTVISLWSDIQRDRVRINVADQGPGIPAGGRDRLFKEFSKLSTRPTAGEAVLVSACGSSGR